jgi:translation initiation factor IF-2
MKKDKTKDATPRPPIIVVMGHIDHGKSTLLDYIRKTNIVDKEAGGITQHISAYEVVHTGKSGKENTITFLDTPGHEAFQAIRSRGASVADIAILVVSAEDGVKPQTIEAYKAIQKDELPFVVAINKIDKAGADIEKAKQSLAENDIFVEGYGGNVPWVPISSKTGEGIPELLDMLLLVSELEELTGDHKAPGKGVIIESNMDTKKGITATVLVTDGTLKRGQFAVSGKSISPLRIVENFLGKPIESATFSTPIRIIGWDTTPAVGANFVCVDTKKEALELVESFKENIGTQNIEEETNLEITTIPIVIKADTAGSLDALVYEIGKLNDERVKPKIILSSIGPISENDIRTAGNNNNAFVLGFHTSVDPKAESLALRMAIPVHTFDIIYKLTEWLTEAIKERTPSIEVEEVTGVAKILKVFSKNKDKQIVGGRVETGEISVGGMVRILRRDIEISRGRIRELQQAKQKTSTVIEGNEFGSMIEAKFEIAPGDKIECFSVVNK